MRWEPPDEFEEYRIVRPLGHGAMGQVYLAHDTLLDRPVAIKFIGAIDVGQRARERFFTEARAVARLSHPNVVGVHRVGEVRRRPYLVSEYVRGASLDRVDKPMPWERALELGIGLARGLASAHRRGVLHRDIKPANVVVGDDGVAKLLDFGLAKLLDAAGPPADITPPPIDLPDGPLDATTSIAGRPVVPVIRGAEIQTFDTGPGVTAVGAIVGTPLYLAPELWRGEPASRRADVYSLGILLYELVTGAAPHASVSLPELAKAAQDGAPPVSSRAAGLPARFAELIDACIATEPARRPESGDALCERLEALAARDPALAPAGNPYRGLGTFQPEHRAVFFGRATEARAVIDRLRTDGFVVVAGDSGAGKSSLCRAGVLPAIGDGVLGGPRRWRTLVMTPGPHPVAMLDETLARIETAPPSGIDSGDDATLLFVDQLEELLTVAPPDEAAAAAERLAELAVPSPRFRLLASARGDFLGRLAGLPALGELVGPALHLLGPLGERGVREAIVGPARALGYELETSTVDELVASGRRNLPLLQFTLAELWDARDDATRRIPASALAQLGGVAGALARHADQVMANLGEADRELAWRILVRLTTAEGTRAIVARAELGEVAGDAEAAERVVERLVRARLLVAIEHDRVEVVHEALFTGWPRLVEWRRAHQEGARLRDQLAEAARQWHERGRPRGLLWRDDALAEYRVWRRRWPEKPTALELAFGTASEREARRVRRRRIAILAAIAAALVTGIVVLYRVDRRAEAERESADTARANAERQKRVLLGEQARAELANDHAGRALPYLAQALREGEDTPANRLLVAEASRPFLAEIATITDFREGLSSMAWSPDGSRFVVGGGSGATRARIYDRDGKLVRELPGHPDGMWTRGFDAAGTHVITIGPEGTVRVFDATTAEAVAIHADPPIHDARFDASGGRVVVAAAGARVHDARTGAVVATLTTTEISGAVFSPDGTRVALAEADGGVELRDAATGTLVHRFAELPRGTQRQVRFSRDGTRLYSGGGDKLVWVWDTASFAPIATLAGHTGYAALGDITADDRLIATTSGGDPVKLWDARTYKLLADLSGHATGVIRDARFSADGATLITTATDNTHRLWDVPTRRVQRVLEDPGAVGTTPHSISGAFVAELSRDGSRLITGSGATLRVWHTGKEPLVAELRPSGVLAGVLSPDEQRVAVCGNFGYAAIWSLATGEQLAKFSVPRLSTPVQQLWDVSWSSDGARVVVVGDGGYAQIFAPDGHMLATLAGHTGAINHASFSPDGTKVVTSCDDRTARVWDATTGNPLHVLAGHDDRVISAAWSRDGTKLATAGYDRTARIWDVATGRQLIVLDDSTTQLMDIAFDPTGTKVACAGHDGQAWVWDLRTRTRAAALVGHNASITGIAWSPDGALIATSGGEDETIRVWDAGTGKPLAHRDQPGTPMEVVWSHDGKRVLASGGEVIRLWDFHRDDRSVDAIVEFVRARAPWRLVDGRLELVPR